MSFEEQLLKRLDNLEARLERYERQDRASKLDIWDWIVSRGDNPDTHFRDATIPSGFSWAGSPFVTPTVNWQDTLSRVAVQFSTTSQRSFLYSSTIADNAKVAGVYLATTSADLFVGLRLDDGSDDNYKEVVLKSAVVSSNSYGILEQRSRAGGGGVSSNTANFEIPTPQQVRIGAAVTGTVWSAWSLRPLYRGLFAPGASFWAPNADAGGNASWTPTRVGLVFGGGASYATWMKLYADWVEV